MSSEGENFHLRELPISGFADRPCVTVMEPQSSVKAVYSHVQVFNMVAAIAMELRESGVRPRTVCAFLMPNSIEAVVLFLALQWIGAVAVPLSPSMDMGLLSTIITTISADIIISPYVDEKRRLEDDLHKKVSSVCNNGLQVHWMIAQSIEKGIYMEFCDVLREKTSSVACDVNEFDYHSSEISFCVPSFDTAPGLMTNISNAAATEIIENFCESYDLCSNQTTLLLQPMNSVDGLMIVLSSMASGGNIFITDMADLDTDAITNHVFNNSIDWLTVESKSLMAMVEKLVDSDVNDSPLGSLNLVRYIALESDVEKYEDLAKYISGSIVHYLYHECNYNSSDKSSIEEKQHGMELLDSNRSLLDAIQIRLDSIEERQNHIEEVNAVKISELVSRVNMVDERQRYEKEQDFLEKLKKKNESNELLDQKKKMVELEKRIEMLEMMDCKWTESNSECCSFSEEINGNELRRVNSGKKNQSSWKSLLNMRSKKSNSSGMGGKTRLEAAGSDTTRYEQRSSRQDSTSITENVNRTGSHLISSPGASGALNMSIGKIMNGADVNVGENLNKKEAYANESVTRKEEKCDMEVTCSHRNTPGSSASDVIGGALAMMETSVSEETIRTRDGAILARLEAIEEKQQSIENNEEEKKIMDAILRRIGKIEDNQNRTNIEIEKGYRAEMEKLHETISKLEEGQSKQVEFSKVCASDMVNLAQTQQKNIQESMKVERLACSVQQAAESVTKSSRDTVAAVNAAHDTANAARYAADKHEKIANNSKCTAGSLKKTLVISLDDVERVISAHPSVKVARAFGRPDKQYGTEVFCVVSLTRGARVSDKWLRLHAQSLLPSGFVPKSFYYKKVLDPMESRADLASNESMEGIEDVNCHASKKKISPPSRSPKLVRRFPRVRNCLP